MKFVLLFLVITNSNYCFGNESSSEDLVQKLVRLGYNQDVARKFVEYDRETVIAGLEKETIDISPINLYRGIHLLPQEIRFTNPPGETYISDRINFAEKLINMVQRSATGSRNGGKGTILEVQLPNYLIIKGEPYPRVLPENLPNLWPFVSHYSLVEGEGFLGHVGEKGYNWQKEAELLKLRPDLKLVISKESCTEIFKKLSDY